MKISAKRVAERMGVSSKTKTKIFSLVFVLAITSASLYIFSAAGETNASDITINKVIELTNFSRSQNSEGSLNINAKLSRAAEAKADDMIAKNYFSHTSPGGATPWKWIDGENYDYSYAGENLAMDFQSAEKMEDAWMKSPTHRANILNEKYKDIGVAVKTGSINGDETILAVVMFGSGDKESAAALKPQTDISKAREGKSVENISSMLPRAEEKRTAINFQEPVITSPQAGERLSNDEVKITGRAEPGSEVNVFDNDQFLYSATADASGWFSLAKNFSEGEHNLRIRSDKVFQGAQTSFFVDQKKPEIEYHLFADQNNPQQFFLETSANKKGCTFQLDGESRYAAEGNKGLFAIDSKNSPAILRVWDQAGNKNFKQINIANYYFDNRDKNNISNKLANLIFPQENVFALNSGREAMKSNLGIAPHQFLASRIANNN